MKSSQKQQTEERVRHWIKTQHGTAGWEQKLVTLVESLVSQAEDKKEHEWRERITQVLRGINTRRLSIYEEGLVSQQIMEELYTKLLSTPTEEKGNIS